MRLRVIQTIKAVFHKALKQAQESNSKRIDSVNIALGEIAELDQDEMKQCWGELSKATPLEHAQIHFRMITAEAQCMACFRKYHPVAGNILCPHCGSFGAKILSGEEFHFESIEADNE